MTQFSDHYFQNFKIVSFFLVRRLVIVLPLITFSHDEAHDQSFYLIPGACVLGCVSKYSLHTGVW